VVADGILSFELRNADSSMVIRDSDGERFVDLSPKGFAILCRRRAAL
jgi:hypothetical protein